jgi:hypothetical protein
VPEAELLRPLSIGALGVEIVRRGREEDPSLI